MHTNRNLVRLAAAAALLVTATSAAVAQTPFWRPETLAIPAADLLPVNDGVAYDTNGVRMAVLDPSGVFVAPVELPNPAVIVGARLEAYDNSGGEIGGFVRAALQETRFNTFLSVVTVQTDQFGAPGDTTVDSGPLGYVTNNTDYAYVLQVEINRGSGTVNDLFFYRFVIEYFKADLY